MDRATARLVSRPEIVQRGFIELGESEELLEDAKDRVERTLRRGVSEEVGMEWSTITAQVKEAVGSFLFERTKRRPLILPVPVEV